MNRRKAAVLFEILLVSVALVACGPSTDSQQESSALTNAKPSKKPPPPKFTITDLGTLGGFVSHSYTVNSSGQVFGDSTNAANEARIFSWTKEGGIVDLGAAPGFVVATSPRGQMIGIETTSYRSFSWTPEGGTVWIGTLGGTCGSGAAVNVGGQVVGTACTTGDAAFHAFSWTQEGGMVDLGTLGGTYSWGVALNTRGEMVGQSYVTGDVEVHATLWQPSGARCRQGPCPKFTVTDLGTLGGTNSGAVAVNERGQVVGSSSMADGSVHAFSWTKKGGMVDLGTVGGTNSAATLVNNSGQVAGSSDTAQGGHAFSWTKNGGMVDLGTVGGTSSGPVAISDTGQVVGLSSTAGEAATHAFSWTKKGGMVDLGTLEGGTDSYASAVNGRGWVVGGSNLPPGYGEHAVLWETERTPWCADDSAQDPVQEE